MLHFKLFTAFLLLSAAQGVKFSKNNLVKKIPTLLQEWLLSVEVSPVATVTKSGFTNLLHATNNSDKATIGDRTPGIWFFSDSTKLRICSAGNGNKDHCYDSLKALPLNTWTKIQVEQKLDENLNSYIFSVYINETLLHNVTNSQASIFRNVKLYASDPWYDQANAHYRHLNFVSLEIKFISQPTLFTKSLKLGNTIDIRGFRFSSILLLQQLNVFWLKNGYQKIPATLFKEEVHVHSSPFPRHYTVGNLSYPVSNYSHQGYYQCVIEIPGYLEDRSTKINVQFDDLSDTRLVVKINDEFDESYLNPVSENYKQMKKKVENELQTILDAEDNDEELNHKRIVEVVQFRPGSIEAIVQIAYQNVSSDERFKFCSKSPMKPTDFKALEVLSVQVNNLDCCSETSFGENSFKGEYVFSETLASNASSSACVYNKANLSRIQCIPNLEDGPQWSEIDLKKCNPKSETTKQLLQINETTICNSSNNSSDNCTNFEIVSENLVSTISNGSVITTKEDIDVAANVMKNIITAIQSLENLTEITPKTDKVIQDLLQVVDNVLDANVSTIAKAQKTTRSSDVMLENLDNLAKTIGKVLVQQENGSYSRELKNIGMAVSYQEKSDVKVAAKEVNITGDIGKLSLTILSNENITSQMRPVSSISVPEEVFPSAKEIIYSYVFRNDDFFLNSRRLRDLSYHSNSGTSTRRRSVQSFILSTSIGDEKITNLTKPISLSFKKIKSGSLEGNTSCGFWDFNLGPAGHWSKRGCYLTNDKDISGNYISCQCNHLTNFALLLDVSQSGNNPLELQIVTLIGCGISLAGLFLTIMTFFIFKNLRKKLPPKILLCLCFSLMMLLIIFLVGIEETSSRKACQTTAALLQYFMLTTFAWMLVEGINLYRLFVKVFKTGGEEKFFVVASVFAWGLPAVIVGITAGAEPDNLGNDNFCVVHGLSFYIAILLPIAFTLLINVVILIAAMRNLMRTRSVRNNPKAQNTLRQARVAFMFSILLGITWVFALLAVSDVTTVFQWLFCIFNSLQGFFIFVFYTLRNADARKEWKKVFGITDKGDQNALLNGEKHNRRFVKVETTDKNTPSTPDSKGHDSSSDQCDATERLTLKSFKQL